MVLASPHLKYDLNTHLSFCQTFLGQPLTMLTSHIQFHFQKIEIMRKADKLFQLINLIRAKQPITAERISQELNVSVRTVYRYVEDLSVSGIPIFGTTGIGYQMLENFELPALNLTEKELEALLLGMKMVTSWSGIELSHAAQSMTTKIQSVLPKNLINDFSEIIFAPDIVNSKSNKLLWESIHKATKGCNIIDIQYNSLDEVATSRKIYPLGLVYWGSKWTLAAWCTTKQDFRNFRIDRIVCFEVLEETFELNENISLDSYMAANNKTQ